MIFIKGWMRAFSIYASVVLYVKRRFSEMLYLDYIKGDPGLTVSVLFLALSNFLDKILYMALDF